GGPTATVLAGRDGGPRGPQHSALALRLLAGVHALVLERRAGTLALSWPTVGGTWEAEAGAEAVLRLLAERPDEVGAWLDRPPQTNEVGRAAALVGGLLHLEDDQRLPVRLVELGASAGLNLLADRFALLDGAGTVLQGDPDSGVRLEGAWAGRAPRPWPGLRFVDPIGCDLHPVDATSAQGRLALSAYVWPDQPARWERLRAGLALAVDRPPLVRLSTAADLLDGLELREGRVTVVWHSVVSQYLDADERFRVRARLDELGASATATTPLAHLALEPAGPEASATPAPGELVVTLRTWPGPVEERVLGHAPAHGLPTTWT
ncbi:MAG: hypothetical protein JWR42_73, partial [Marmoricola sp.]|nr:hypothetical protein [Marmoricola sp.]